MNSRSSAFFEDQAFLDTAGLSVPVLDPDYTALDKFLTSQVFLPVCNPFTRNRANSVTVLFKRVRTNFYQSQHWNGFFLSKARNYAPGLCKNLHGSGVVKEEPHQSKILTYF